MNGRWRMNGSSFVFISERAKEQEDRTQPINNNNKSINSNSTTHRLSTPTSVLFAFVFQ